ncbi:MAG: mitochondrial large ribosomal subunit protein uL30m [Myxococcales bacterium]|nr:mitochondrial large ribosomal subunit protein uL30m [Myxococcales bacterium]
MRNLASLFAAFALSTVLVACQQATNLPSNNNPTNPNTSNTKASTPIDPNNATFPTPTTGAEPKHFEDHWQSSSTKEGTSAQATPYYGRQARRLSIDQIKKSIPQLFNGITWTDTSNRNMFDQYAITLGKADYIEVTANNREASSLFMKFMDDMASYVCSKAVEADLKMSDTDKRSVVRYPEDVDKTLRFLRLKLHAVFVPTGSTKGIEKLRKLQEAIMTQTKSEAKAWTGVCIAMVASPDFFAY